MTPIEVPRCSSADLALILTTSWRPHPLPVQMEKAQLDLLLPSLLDSGAGALAWRRLRDSTLSTEQAAVTLQQLQLTQALGGKLQERKIVASFKLLESHGVQPLLIKGWSTARLYSEAGSRAVGDIDFLIDAKDDAIIEQLLGVKADQENEAIWDVKSRVPALYRVSAAELFERQQRVVVGDTTISICCPEDHLRLLCLHFLKHGGWRPLWLCDIAAALEFRPANFDWHRCLGTDPWSSNAIIYTLALANQLLGASLENTPIVDRAKQLPSWLIPVVLRAWETPHPHPHQLQIPFKKVLRDRKGVFNAIIKRWPNPIQAATELQVSFKWPPLLIQIISLAARSGSFLKTVFSGRKKVRKRT